MTTPSPLDGDRVFHCGHLHKTTHHFFQITDRPRITTERTWLVICKGCFATGKDPLKMIRGDGLWGGDRPVDYKEQS